MKQRLILVFFMDQWIEKPDGDRAVLLSIKETVRPSLLRKWLGRRRNVFCI